MTLADFLKHSRNTYVYVYDELSGDCIMQGTDNSVLHTENCEDYIVDNFNAGFYGKPVIYVEVL